MPWETPDLKTVRSLVRDMITGALPGADALVPNSVLRVMSDNQGALCHLTLQYISWLSLQLIPDTAETEWLDRHGNIWLLNADGTTGRKMATLASGTVNFTGTGGVIPQYAQLTGPAGNYETTSVITTDPGGAPSPGPVRALDPGIDGNLLEGVTLSLVDVPSGVDAPATIVEMDGGVDEETDDELRYRVLLRIREPPMGGDAKDYVQWALAVSGVTRAWCAPLEMGIGTVTVRFLMDDLRASNDGFPYSDDIDAVIAYLNTVRPVAVKDFFVCAPIKQFIDVHIANLVPDTGEIRGEIENGMQAMLLRLAAPGQTIFAAWKSYVVMSAPNVISFDLVNNVDDVMPTPGHMPVLGDIYYR